MSSVASTIQVSGLARQKVDLLRAQAKAAGMTTSAYAKQLIEQGISLEKQARSKTFDQLYAPVQEEFRKSGMREDELNKLVERARTRHHRHTRKKA